MKDTKEDRMHPKLAEFADMLCGIGVLYQIKLLGSKGLRKQSDTFKLLSTTPLINS